MCADGGYGGARELASQAMSKFLMLKFGIIPRIALAAVLAFAVTGCTQTIDAGPRGFFGFGITKPSAILVDDFNFAPEFSNLDRRLAARLRRDLKGQSADAVRAEVARRVSAVISDTIITALREADLQASPGSAALALADETTLVIAGHVRAVDQNDAKRKSVDFGGSRKDTAADIQVTYVSSAGRKGVLNFDAENETPRISGSETPDAAVAQVATTSFVRGVKPDDLSPAVESHARRIGQAVAKRVIAFAVEQGWIAARSRAASG